MSTATRRGKVFTPANSPLAIRTNTRQDSGIIDLSAYLQKMVSLVSTLPQTATVDIKAYDDKVGTNGVVVWQSATGALGATQTMIVSPGAVAGSGAVSATVLADYLTFISIGVTCAVTPANGNVSISVKALQA